MNEGVRRVLDYFKALSAIPRPSKHEARAARWVAEWAEGNGFEADVDEAHNVVIRAPGTGRRRSRPTVVLQGHLDMVCESTPERQHDCENDPIEPVIGDEWMTANGTTLGADNGIAVAIAFALATDSALSRPPLELLFTSDEETGLNGAKALRPGFVTGTRMINLDSEIEGRFTVGCAGGRDSTITLPIRREPRGRAGTYARIQVGGLKGGHSGADIHLARGNANKILARTLDRLSREREICLIDIHGGSAHNAIPRDAYATFWTPGERIEAIETRIKLFRQKLEREFGDCDPDLSIEASPIDPTPVSPIAPADTMTLVSLLVALPHGIDRMSSQIDGLVETSSNLATVRTKDDAVQILTSQRSSLASRLSAITGRIAAVARLAGASMESTEGYPAWEPNLDSPLLARARETYTTVFGEAPEVDVIHAGLECGVIGSIYPEMDMISIGPTIEGAHSPDERLNLGSLERVWRFLSALLSEMD